MPMFAMTACSATAARPGHSMAGLSGAEWPNKHHLCKQVKAIYTSTQAARAAAASQPIIKGNPDTQ